MPSQEPLTTIAGISASTDFRPPSCFYTSKAKPDKKDMLALVMRNVAIVQLERKKDHRELQVVRARSVFDAQYGRRHPPVENRPDQRARLPPYAKSAIIGRRIGIPGTWRSWLPLTLRTQYIFRCITRPCTGGIPFEIICGYHAATVSPTSHSTLPNIKQSGDVAWDVGTYRMSVPQNDGTMRQDHVKYLTVWKRAGKNWLIAADPWSSDLTPAH